MQRSDVKSSTVAGILGVFLGAFGGHDWYLGNTKKAIMHTSLCVGGLILLLVGVILDNLSQSVPVINILFVCLIIMAYVIIVGNMVWGMIEGVMILAQGDAGLQAKGYKVADSVAPMTMANPNANPNNANAATGPVKTTIATPGVKVEKEPAADASSTNDVAGVTGDASDAVAEMSGVNNAAGATGNVNGNNVVASAPVAQAMEGQASSVVDGAQVAGGVAEASANAANAAGDVKMTPVDVKAEANTVATAPAEQTANAVVTSTSAGAPVQPAANSATGVSTQPNNDSVSAEGESDVKLVERSSLPQQSTDAEIAKAAEQAVSQANQAMGKE